MYRPRKRRLKDHMEWTIATKKGHLYKDSVWTKTMDCSCCIQFGIRRVSGVKHIWIEEYEHGPECGIMCDDLIDHLIDTCIVWEGMDCTQLRHVIMQYRPNQFTFATGEGLPF